MLKLRKSIFKIINWETLLFLKSSDRFEFALEKCVELGITNFLIFNAKKSYKRGIKLERWNKILLSAMKQSLQSHKPKISFTESLKNYLPENSKKIILEQNSEISINKYFEDIDNRNELFNRESYFIFGPEGGLTNEEIIGIKNSKQLQLTKNRLRAETAIIAVGSFINLL